MGQQAPPPYYTQGPPQPNCGYPQVAPQPRRIIITSPPSVGPDPIFMTCPNCRNVITTTTTSKFNNTGWLAVLVLAFVFFPCACIPCCVDRCHDVEHQCPSCNANLGTYRP